MSANLLGHDIDLKSDNILFRPEDVDAVINQELINDPSCSYDRPEGKPVYGGKVAFRSQPLPPWTGKGSKEVIGKMTAVLADFGHCTRTKGRSYKRRAVLILAYFLTSSLVAQTFPRDHSTIFLASPRGSHGVRMDYVR
jgi:hypothetical protein